ncbi:hypothetical protein Y032_0070g415 [Ancylostoma ceylanicum]|uniref:Uncharacterized protein n=1 Tax=Ancylostoma ceylanicum TaxID=53326 RepID=A0A016TXA3_9BILA|nr:hypothetical protein Y032_0070g415 [Ancylostoma ceylanicum]
MAGEPLPRGKKSHQACEIDSDVPLLAGPFSSHAWVFPRLITPSTSAQFPPSPSTVANPIYCSYSYTLSMQPPL